MTRYILWLWIGLIVLLIAGLLVLALKNNNSPPDNLPNLDQLDIQTDNPQPAGRNITN